MYIADQTKAPEGAEIVGQSVADWVDNLNKGLTDPVFEKYGLSEIDPEGWYSLDIIIDLYRGMAESEGGSASLVAMGKASAKPVYDIFEFKSFEDFIKNGDKPFKAAIRNIPDEYGLSTEKVGERHYRIVNNSIVPNDMIYGYLWEMFRIIPHTWEDYSFIPVSGYSPGSTERAVFEIKEETE